MFYVRDGIDLCAQFGMEWRRPQMATAKESFHDRDAQRIG